MLLIKSLKNVKECSQKGRSTALKTGNVSKNNLNKQESNPYKQDIASYKFCPLVHVSVLTCTPENWHQNQFILKDQESTSKTYCLGAGYVLSTYSRLEFPSKFECGNFCLSMVHRISVSDSFTLITHLSTLGHIRL